MSGPTGLGPAQIQSAYKLAGRNAGARTVALVDADNDPRAASDLAAFRHAYGLSPCTTANGCFSQVNQTGATSPLPSGDYGWAEEESLDLDAVFSACPTCHILLVEANSASTSDLAAAGNAAAKIPGVAAISNSYGGSEASSELSTDSAYHHPGIAVTVSSGDSGYGVEYPAASPYVTAVGGTTLGQASNARGWTETAWSGAGSGCSASCRDSTAGPRWAGPYTRGCMLILPPGHAEAVRRGPVMRPREKWMIGGVVAVVAVLAVALIVSFAAGTKKSGHGCISVALAYSTGGAQIDRCGDAAKALCAGVGRPGGLTGLPARSVAAECRKAGLPVG
jgi:hypothetical protein